MNPEIKHFIREAAVPVSLLLMISSFGLIAHAVSDESLIREEKRQAVEAGKVPDEQTSREIGNGLTVAAGAIMLIPIGLELGKMAEEWGVK